MTGSGPRTLPGVADLEVVDVVGPDAAREDVDALLRVHAEAFPDYPHVLDQIEQRATTAGDDPDVVVHQLLLRWRGQPCGESLADTRRRRGVMTRHHLALLPPARGPVPPTWLRGLTALLVETGRRDCTDPPLLATMSEISPVHLPGWRRWGYRTVDVPYAEPLGGPGWADGGAPQFHRLVPLLYLTEEGRRRPLGEVVTAAMSAFLLDHYRLPADDPVVVSILAAAAALPDDAPDRQPC